MICATVWEATGERAIRAARGVPSQVDLVEIRLDAIADPDPAELVAGIGKPVVLTCRSSADGGAFRGTEPERLALLRRGIEVGAAWIDVEDHAAEALGDRGESRLIVSHHDFKTTPANLLSLVEGMAARDADIVKLVTTATGPEDVLSLLRLLRESDRPLAAHAMGYATIASRVLGASFGSAIVYGAALPGGGGAPGQPTVNELLFGFAIDRPADRRILLFGGDLSHSVSPAMLNPWFFEMGEGVVYVPWPVTDAAWIPRIIRETDAIGAAVTLPLKRDVMDHLDSIDPVAGRIGAVNTVVLDHGGLRGANTDLEGALEPIGTRLPDLASKRALVLGAGGAARAIAFGLADAGARVFIANRTRARAEKLAAAVGGEVATGDEEVDLIVNATPVGQWPEVNESPLPSPCLGSRPVVLDAVYNPRQTRLLRDAESAGCVTIPGLAMLAGQAAAQLKLWLGLDADPEDLRANVCAALERRDACQVLIGLRGTGKTTVGRLLAKRLCRPFVDLDEEIEKAAGRTVAEILANEGLERFRELEWRALEAALTVPGRVISVGGGVTRVERVAPTGESRDLRVILLTASVETMVDRIQDSQRPSLTNLPLEEEVAFLRDHRDREQKQAADLVFDTTDLDPEDVVVEILTSLQF